MILKYWRMVEENDGWECFGRVENPGASTGDKPRPYSIFRK
jgi:hypothetical protein